MFAIYRIIMPRGAKTTMNIKVRPRHIIAKKISVSPPSAVSPEGAVARSRVTTGIARSMAKKIITRWYELPEVRGILNILNIPSSLLLKVCL